ncbi:MAG TPA: bifunctional YncE family protein/alkaline phosphatase family protein, partial [Chthonomonadales bacterium]|nr:bifunctional YncE family protein/alkaline phosphatase family protein [Chthonomonadales bacterium]
NVYRLDRRFDVTATYTVDGYAGAIAPLDAGHIAVTSLVTGKNEAAYKSGVYEKGSLSVIDTGTGAVQKSVSTGYFPVDLQVSSGKLYALLEGENRIEVYDSNLNHVKSIPVGEAPVSIAVDQGKLYAANSGSDSISVIDTTSDNVSNTLHLNTTSTNAGEAPTSCAFSGANIYVTLAGENAVAVLSRSGKPLGKIPTGWYPTRVLAADGMLIVLNAKGIKPRRPNIDGPQPLPGKGGNQYVLTLLNGTVSVLQQSAISAHLGAYSRSVAQSQPAYHLRGPGSPPIKYIFYIIRENRTYDQDFGDIRRANGDPYLTIFGNAVTPNAHAIARRFVTLDNFFTDGEISVLGHSYTTSGYAGPFLQWLGNAAYSGRFDSYPFGTVPAATSPVYLWDALERNKVPYKVFGENYYVYARARRIIDSNFGASSEMAAKFYAQMMALAAQTDRGKAFYNLASRYALQAATPAMASDLLDKAEFARSLSRFLVGDSSLATALATNPKLKADLADYLSHYSLSYASWNLHYSDLDRAAAWKADFEDQLLRGQVARLQYLWLPNDHTGGSNKAYLPPDQLVAQNDAALARIVQTISASTIWKQSLILVVEDDAQDGPDHVDATRTVALAAGPYVKRGAVVSDLYDQLSMLRTIEVLLGLPPLNSE